MRKTFLSLFIALSVFIKAQAGDPVKGTLKVNTTDSKVEWTGRKVTGKHNGTVNIKEGSLQIKDGFLTGGEFTIDMTSIKVTDLTGEYAGKLEGHLKSDDFFNTGQFPTSTLKITQANAKGDGKFEVKGDLTIRGITKPVTFTTQLSPDGKRYKANTNITIDRSQYDVKYGSGKFFEGLGDSTIYDEFDLAIMLVTE